MTRKRADKAADASAWLPMNALYEAYQHIAKTAVEGALIIGWYERDEKGDKRMRLMQWSERPSESIALTTQIANYVSRPR
jgi:hypothetical protein